MMQIGKRKKKRKIRKEKMANGKWGKKMKGKRIESGKEKERRREQNILKNYRVTMKIVNTKYRIVNLKNCEENVICWKKCTLLTKMKLYIRKSNFSHWIKIIHKYFSWYLVWHIISEELTKAKWNYENCIERNKIVQIQRNNYLWLYFVKSY